MQQLESRAACSPPLPFAVFLVCRDTPRFDYESISVIGIGQTIVTNVGSVDISSHNIRDTCSLSGDRRRSRARVREKIRGFRRLIKKRPRFSNLTRPIVARRTFCIGCHRRAASVRCSLSLSLACATVATCGPPRVILRMEAHAFRSSLYKLSLFSPQVHSLSLPPLSQVINNVQCPFRARACRSMRIRFGPRFLLHTKYVVRINGLSQTSFSSTITFISHLFFFNR